MSSGISEKFRASRLPSWGLLSSRGIRNKQHRWNPFWERLQLGYNMNSVKAAESLFRRSIWVGAGRVCSFLGAVITKTTNRVLTRHSLTVPEIRNQSPGVSRAALPETCRGDRYPASPCFWCLQHPQLPGVWVQSAPPQERPSVSVSIRERLSRVSTEKSTLSLITGPTLAVFVFFLISLNSFSLFDILLAFSCNILWCIWVWISFLKLYYCVLLNCLDLRTGAFVLFLQILTQHLTSTVSAPSSALNTF